MQLSHIIPPPTNPDGIFPLKKFTQRSGSHPFIILSHLGELINACVYYFRNLECITCSITRKKEKKYILNVNKRKPQAKHLYFT